MNERARGFAGLVAIVVAAVLLFRALFWIGGALDRGHHAIVVGSKAFTESVILGEIMAQTIEHQAHVRVRRQFDLGGTNVCFQALRTGALDVYPEYTGTGLMAILHHTAMTDPAAVLGLVRETFDRQFGLAWLAPLGFDNSYALAVPARVAARDGLRTISDLRAHPELSYGFATEFLARADGWPGLRARYGLAPSDPPRSMEAGLMYQAAAAGEVDVISAYRTDGRIDAMNLVVLIDDRHFFPPYQAAPLARKSTMLHVPAFRTALETLAGTIDAARMRRMNADADVRHRSAIAIATDFVRSMEAARATSH